MGTGNSPRSDPDLLDALRKQAAFRVAEGKDPWALLIAWDGQPGVRRDDVIDVLKEVSGRDSP